MHTHKEALGKDGTRNMLEPERTELLLLLVLCIHNAYGYRLGDGACCSLLETANEAVDQDWPVHPHEHDNVISYRHYCERLLSSSVH